MRSELIREPATRSAPSTQDLTSHHSHHGYLGDPPWTHQRRHAVSFAWLACLAVLAFIPLAYSQCSGGVWTGGGSPLYDCSTLATVYAATNTTIPATTIAGTAGGVLGPPVVTGKCLAAEPTTTALMATTWWVHTGTTGMRILTLGWVRAYKGLHTLPGRRCAASRECRASVHAPPACGMHSHHFWPTDTW